MPTIRSRRETLRLPRSVMRVAITLGAPAVRAKRLPLAARRGLTDLSGRMAGPPAGVRRRVEPLGGVRGEWLVPEGADPGRVLLYFHGGGYVLGSPASHSSMVARLAMEARAAAYLVDYRLAPEHPWPAAADDAWAAYEGLLGNGHRSGGIGLVGDSAGGGLVLALAMALRDRAAAPPGVVAMICPWLDLADDRRDVRGDGVLTAAGLSDWAAAYVPDPGARGAVGVSPINGELAGLPPLVVHSAGLDLLARDATRLSALAEAAGVPLEHREYPGLWHDFHIFAGRMADADSALGELARSIRRHLPATADVPIHASPAQHPDPPEQPEV